MADRTIPAESSVLTEEDLRKRDIVEELMQSQNQRIVDFAKHLLTVSFSAIGVVLALIVAYAGLVFWVRGCCGYAVSKGRSRWLGMVGLSGPVGLILIALLPQKSAASLTDS